MNRVAVYKVKHIPGCGISLTHQQNETKMANCKNLAGFLPPRRGQEQGKREAHDLNLSRSQAPTTLHFSLQ